ncbi:MAG: AMP-dependent synthetase/ligase [Acidobacteriota bacterium]
MFTGTYENLVELAEASVERYANRPLFGERRDDTWEWTTYAAWQRDVDQVRAGLAALGILPGDKIAIISRNSAVWATAAYAAYGLGATFVPMYEQQRPEDWEFILRDCGAVAVFCRSQQIVEAIDEMQPRLPALGHVIAIEGSLDDARSLLALRQHGRVHPIAPRFPKGDELAGLIYTSGTTGKPKGVMLTHRNLTSNVIATLSEFPLTREDRSVSFLPWAHVYGQVVELHMLVAAGASTAFNRSTEHLLEDLADVKPTILVAVPRIFNKLHIAVRSQIEHKPKLVRRLFDRGIAASIKKHRGNHLTLGERFVCFLAGFLFAAVRRKLGGHLKYAISGSATLSRDVAEFINGLGIEVYEGYGLTETSPIATANRPGHRKLGSVGQVIPGVSIELDETRGESPGEGEIIIHGPNVMKGYFNRPEENARTFTANGGLRTGDLGRVDEDGYLSITGRIKELYKLENGKYVMPTQLEERLQLSPFIQNVMLYGASRPYNVALVVIDVDRVRAWAAERGITLETDVAQDARVQALIHDEIASLARDFRPYERPLECHLTIAPLTVENGFLTPTLKLKRRTILDKFGAALEALYAMRPHLPHAA